MDSISFVSARYPPYIGGVETHVSELAKRAVHKFRRVSVITTDPSGNLPHLERNGGPTIYRIRSFAPHENYHIPSPRSLLHCLRSSNPGLLHLHGVHDVPGPLAGVLETRIPLLLTPHFVGRLNSTLGRMVFTLYRPLVQTVVEKAAYVICMSRFEESLIVEDFPHSKGKTRIIPNGVDSQVLSNFPWKETETPRVLYAGRLEMYKNVDKLLRAFSGLAKSHPALKLSIVGSGPAKAELVRMSTDLGLSDRIEWYGRLSKSQLYELYSRSTVVVVPSQSENYGIVAAEAISIGAPTVVANASGLSSFVDMGLAVGVDTPVSAANLEEAISKVLVHPGDYSRMGHTSEFIPSWDRVAERTFSLYESLS